MDKQALRRLIRTRKQAYAPASLRAQSLAIVARLLQHPRLQSAQTVLLYYSLPDEVDTHQLADTLLAQGKQVLLPRVVSDTEMEVRCYTGTADLEAQGKYHILEPTGALFTDYGSIDLVVVPGMAFDRQGHRMGRGRGYYDRFLPLCPNAYKIGICFAFQLVDDVPVTPTDIAMDAIISNTEN